MTAPTLMLWLVAMVSSLVAAMGPDGARMPDHAELVATVAWQFVIASWVVADARKRGRRLCHDFDSFAFFAWPVVVPFYLFQTRGVRTVLTLMCFAGIWLVAALVSGLAVLMREL